MVARTDRGRPRRVVVAGHLDTVPATDENARPRRQNGALYGVGAADMKGGLAVLLHLARSLEQPDVDVTWCFYACEEVEQRHNGMRRLFEVRPDLLAADVAILAEPTAGVVEAGCQGTLQVRVEATRPAGAHGPAGRGPQRHPSARPAAGRGVRLLGAPSGHRRV